MFIAKLKPLFLAAAVTAFAGIAAEAPAAVLLVDDAGQLTGAEDVDVNGTLYDVTFADGSCVGLFGGCDEDSDFTFNVQADALAAAQALLDQVFVNVVLGDFDSVPSLTQGCESGDNCGAAVPHGFFNDLLQIVIARNNPLADADTINQGLTAPDNDFTLVDTATYALFTAASPGDPDDPSSDVPAPSALLLLGFGLAGLGFANRKARWAA